MGDDKGFNMDFLCYTDNSVCLDHIHYCLVPEVVWLYDDRDIYHVYIDILFAVHYGQGYFFTQIVVDIFIQIVNTEERFFIVIFPVIFS